MLKQAAAWFLISCLFLPFAWADEQADIKAINKVFSKIIPGSKPDSVSPSSLGGIYEVVYGAQVLYMSNDGRYVIQGDLIDLEKQENVTESTRSIQRAKLVKGIDDATAIIFAPKEVKHTITVFTDIDCGYCRKLHREINQYLDQGIKVRSHEHFLCPRVRLRQVVAIVGGHERNAAFAREAYQVPIHRAVDFQALVLHLQEEIALAKNVL